jgi:tetratricopeptide (TPR) repeat protein
MLFYCLVLGPAHVDSAIRRSERILADGRFRGVEGVGRAALASLYAMRGDFDEVRQLLGESREILDDLGQTRRRLEAAFFAATAELLAGSAEEAAEQLRWAHDAAAAMRQSGLAASHGAHLAEALYALGRFDEADAAAVAAGSSAASDDVFTQVKWRAVHAKVLAGRGDPAAAAHAHRAVELAATMDDLNSHAAALADLAEVLRATGRTEDAETAVAEARDLYRSKGNVVGAQRLGAPPLQQISTRRAR